MTVALASRVDDVGACHCSMCRRWGSGPWLGLRAPPGTRVEGPALTVFRSSIFAERGFCGVCGSHIFYRMQDVPDMEVSSGLFEDACLHLSREIFHDSKPAFYAFVGATAKKTGLQMKIAYGPRLAAAKAASLVRRWLRPRRPA